MGTIQQTERPGRLGTFSAKLPPYLKGPLLAFAIILLFQIILDTPYITYAPFPVCVLMVMVIYSVFVSGTASGMISALMTVGYLGYFLAQTHGFEQNPADAWNRLLSWTVALPIIVGLVGSLKRQTVVAAREREQKDVESLIENYKLRIEMILKSVSAVIWAVDANGIITFSDGTGLQKVGLKPGERIGTSIYSLHDSDSEIIKGFVKALSGESSKALSNLRGTWFESSITPFRDPQGTITGAVGMAIDVTNRLETENAKAQLLASEKAAELIRASEAKFKGAFENSPIGIGLATPDGAWIDVNPALCKMLGYTKQELQQKNIAEITPDEDQAVGAAMRAKLLAGEVDHVSFEKRYLHKDGHSISFWINGSLIRNPDGSVQFVLGQMVDVTARRRAEKALEESTRRLEMLIRSSPVAILTLDEKNNVSVWNPACEKMFGWSAEEALGHFLPFVPKERISESKIIIEKISRERQPVHFEADRVKKDGTPIKTATAAIPLLNDQGVVVGLMAVMMDHTARFRAEQDLLAANRALKSATEAKSEFLANMSHEIRTPINGVMGMTGLLLDLELGPEQRLYAETIRSSADILLTLINDILDFSKIEAGKIDLESIDFTLDGVLKTVEGLMSVAATKKGLRLRRSSEPLLDITVFRGDPNRLSQVLTNLVSNAIKFTERGQVSIDIFAEAVEANSSLTKLRIEVSDTGIGLTPEVSASLFQAFTQADASTTRRFGGTGLGLSISKRLVELMGGQIGVRSQVNQGSTFWFTLTLSKSAQTEQIASPAPTPLKPLVMDKPLRILLAEDNAVNQLIAIKTLEKNGFRVDAVVNGLEALHALAALPYDLVLMDCQMPEMDGYESTRQIRSSGAAFRDIPIVAMTANAMLGDREKCFQAGMNNYVTKPITPHELIAVIRRTLSQASDAIEKTKKAF